MSDSKVETTARLAQWKIENLLSCSYRRSDPFKMGLWNWHLSVEKNRYLHVRLFPEPSRSSKDQPPVATFVLRIYNVAVNKRPWTSPAAGAFSGASRTFPCIYSQTSLSSTMISNLIFQAAKLDETQFLIFLEVRVQDRLLRSSEDFVWPVETTFHGRFIIDVEFLDLKVASMNGGELSSIWPNEGDMQSKAIKGALRCLTHMLDDGVHTDVTINTANGSVRAHWAILAARSPVFERMFLQDFKGKESSTIDIEDISFEACMALLSYIYGGIKFEDFRDHRIALLRASEKFVIGDLKEACEDSLLEDINCKNVLERLQQAWLYQLTRLKNECFKYLFDFGKIHDVREDLNIFLQHADRKLTIEMFQEVLNVWRLI